MAECSAILALGCCFLCQFCRLCLSTQAPLLEGIVEREGTWLQSCPPRDSTASACLPASGLSSSCGLVPITHSDRGDIGSRKLRQVPRTCFAQWLFHVQLLPATLSDPAKEVSPVWGQLLADGLTICRNDSFGCQTGYLQKLSA